MKRILIISLIAVLGITYLSLIYVYAKPLQEKVSTELKEDINRKYDKTEWMYLGLTTVTEFNNSGEIVKTFDEQLYVRVINNQLFYRIGDGTYDFHQSNSISKYTQSQEYNAMYRGGKFRLNVPHW